MACDSLARALATGEPIDRAHAAACPSCRALLDAPVATPPPVPSARAFRAHARRRVVRHAAVVAALNLLAVGAVAAWLSGDPAPEPVATVAEPDLIEVLADAALAVEVADDAPGTEVLALLDPADLADLADEEGDAAAYDLSASDDLLDALLGEGSL